MSSRTLTSTNRYLQPIYSKGPCDTCRRKRDLYRGRCGSCRKPIEIREICDAGVPWMSGLTLMYIMKKAGKEADKVLRMVHPRTMANIRVQKGIFKIVDKRYRWIRRQGWARQEQT